MVSVFPESEKGRFTKQTMADALHHIQTAEIDSVRFPMLSGAYQIIGLLAHMEQHLATSGIGLRQVCDWAVTAHALRNCFDGETLALLERCGLLRFARIMTRLCERYLGLPPCPWTADASDALVDAMLSDVLEGGNFQAQYAKRPLADVLTGVPFFGGNFTLALIFAILFGLVAVCQVVSAFMEHNTIIGGKQNENA